MPELPEVETVRKVITPILVGRTIKSIDVLRTTTIVGSVNEFVSTLVGKTFKSISRIGKFLIFHLSDDKVFISHLRMEGKYYDLDEKEANTTYSRVVFHLDNGRKICYDDSRCFGIMILSTEQEYKNVKDIAQLGPEPFYVDDVFYLMKRTARLNIPVKAALLDQTLMAGIGNIYADEILFASKVHPLTPARLIKKTEWEAILENSKKILSFAIEQGGSTIRSYHPGKDIDGRFQGSLQAYGKVGEPCPICGLPMRYTKVNGRGTTYCAHCQEKKGSPIKVAIFGKIASGKSSVLSTFSKAKIKTISCDDIVHKLYEKKEIIHQVNSLFNLPNKDILDKEAVRELAKIPSNKKKLENLIHPLVINEVNKFLNQSDDILAVEVPLLFEAKMENMFDVIIATDINEENQIKRLENRNGKYAAALKFINGLNNKFEENKKKADFVVNNNSDLNNLNKEVNEIISKLKVRLG